MVETKQLLVRCFSAVFPSLSPDQIVEADASNVTGWDSVASVTLFATIEEEFVVEIDIQDMKDLLSFERMLAYLERKASIRET